jgi:hypothetical protein
MKMKHVLSAGFGALALGLVAGTAQAAPIGGLGVGDVKAADAGLVEKVHWYGRGYGWHYGYKPYYGYGYGGYYKPYYRSYKPYGWRYGYGGYYRRGY